MQTLSQHLAALFHGRTIEKKELWTILRTISPHVRAEDWNEVLRDFLTNMPRGPKKGGH